MTNAEFLALKVKFLHGSTTGQERQAIILALHYHQKTIIAVQDIAAKEHAASLIGHIK